MLESLAKVFFRFPQSAGYVFAFSPFSTSPFLLHHTPTRSTGIKSAGPPLPANRKDREQCPGPFLYASRFARAYCSADTSILGPKIRPHYFRSHCPAYVWSKLLSQSPVLHFCIVLLLILALRGRAFAKSDSLARVLLTSPFFMHSAKLSPLSNSFPF